MIKKDFYFISRECSVGTAYLLHTPSLQIIHPHHTVSTSDTDVRMTRERTNENPEPDILVRHRNCAAIAFKGKQTPQEETCHGQEWCNGTEIVES